MKAGTVKAGGAVTVGDTLTGDADAATGDADAGGAVTVEGWCCLESWCCNGWWRPDG